MLLVSFIWHSSIVSFSFYLHPLNHINLDNNFFLFFTPLIEEEVSNSFSIYAIAANKSSEANNIVERRFVIVIDVIIYCLVTEIFKIHATPALTFL